jgi:lysophospholipase L1-like esterase
MNMLARTLSAATAVVVGQAAWAIWRPLPTFVDLDSSGTEGPEDGTPLRMVVLGDSSCTGSGLQDPSDIWVRVLARMIGTHGYRVEVVSFAVGGSKASDLVQDQLRPAVELGGDIALISVGGNDALRGVRLAPFEDALDTLVSSLSGAVGTLALSGVGDMGTVPRLPHTIAAAARRRGRAMNAIHHRVAARHGVLVADQWAWAVERFKDRTVFSPDLFHPNADGHRVWAEVAYELLAPTLLGQPALRPDPGPLGGDPG